MFLRCLGESSTEVEALSPLSCTLGDVTTRTDRDVQAEVRGERPLRRDAERNRQRILAAAREVFAERGLAATLDDVAHRAGVGVGTVYRRFPDKESLVEAAMESRLEEVVAVLEAALARSSAWDGFSEFLRQTAAMHAADRGLRDVALSAGHGKDHLPEIRGRIEPLVRALVDRAHAEGTLRPDAGAHDIPMIHLMVSVVAQHAANVRRDLHERYLDLLLDGLRNRPGNGALGDPLTVGELEDLMRTWKPAAS